MKKWNVLVGLLIFSLVFVACGSSETVDAKTYITEKLVELEKKAAVVTSEFQSVSGTNYKDDQTMLAKLKDSVLPKMKELVDDSKKITPKDESLKKIHEMYNEILAKQNEGFETYVKGLEKTDKTIMEDGNKLFVEAQTKVATFGEQLKAFAEKEGIEFPNK